MVKSNGKKINTAVFISGRGSNLKSLINYFKMFEDSKNDTVLVFCTFVRFQERR